MLLLLLLLLTCVPALGRLIIIMIKGNIWECASREGCVGWTQ